MTHAAAKLPYLLRSDSHSHSRFSLGSTFEPSPTPPPGPSPTPGDVHATGRLCHCQRRGICRHRRRRLRPRTRLSRDIIRAAAYAIVRAVDLRTDPDADILAAACTIIRAVNCIRGRRRLRPRARRSSHRSPRCTGHRYTRSRLHQSPRRRICRHRRYRLLPRTRPSGAVVETVARAIVRAVQSADLRAVQSAILFYFIYLK